MTGKFDIRLADETTLSREDLRPVTIVSVDSHACLPPKMYKQYLDSQYHDDFQGFLDDAKIISKIVDLLGYPTPQDERDVYDPRDLIEHAGEVGYFDPVWRLRQVEREGVAAEFLHPFGTIGFTPFIDLHNSPRSHELRAAGAAAHTRFLLDFCSEAPGRLLGVPWVYPWPDWDAAVEQIRAAHAAGWKAIYPPNFAGVPGDLPALYDPWWDPMWRTCEELGMAVHVHAAFGNPQGSSIELAKIAFGGVAGGAAGDGDGLAAIDASMMPKFNPDGDQVPNTLLAQFFETFGERRPLWQLMWGGVFDRFPKLKIGFAEIHCDWVPLTLAYLDRKHAEDPGPLTMRPSEYWARHCVIGASLMRYGDVAARHDVGITKVMFGTDMPHIEGTWPNTQDWIRRTLGGIPEGEARAILGENAIEFYGLDRALLERTAKRVGPLASELFTGVPVDPRLVRHFEFRAGLNKDVNFDEAQMTEAFEADRAGALGALATVSAGSV